METLTSLKNPKIQAWRSLKEKKGREEHQAFLVEGVRMVREAFASSFTVKALLLRENFDPGFSVPAGTPVYLCRARQGKPHRKEAEPDGVSLGLQDDNFNGVGNKENNGGK